MRMDEIGYHHRHDLDFYVDRPNGAGDWLLLVIKTSAIFRIDGKDVKVKANSYILYTPEYPEYYAADPDAEEYIDDWIHFGPDEKELALIRQLEIPLNCPFYIGDISVISNLIRNMCHEFYSAHLHRNESVDLYFRMLIYKIHEKIESAYPVSVISESVYGEKLIWIRECIYRKPTYEWNIDEIATDLSLSRSRFQHLYSDTFGVGVTQDIIASRIEYSAELLKNPELTIEKVAEICGYTSTSYFIRQFKETKGITPARYRKAQ